MVSKIKQREKCVESGQLLVTSEQTSPVLLFLGLDFAEPRWNFGVLPCVAHLNFHCVFLVVRCVFFS